MSHRIGKIVIMGSGELTATMVDVHRDLLADFPNSGKAVFLDTPAGFQLNADQISQRAVEYCRNRIQHSLSVASFKSKAEISTYEAEQAFHILREADYTLIGPGSPTYAVAQWKDTPIYNIFINNIKSGGCLVAASAAALTVGRFTLPVYEIYKVGADLHWIEGLNILGAFGFNLVVIPHWNNAEGGTHDTRCCFMGETRFAALTSLLPEDVFVLGIDEHTACIMDMDNDVGEIRGIGRMILRYVDSERVFQKGDRFPLSVLRGMDKGNHLRPVTSAALTSVIGNQHEEASFWKNIHKAEAQFQEGIDACDAIKAINGLLDLDQWVWQAQQDRESEEFISQAREILRECIVLLGTILTPSPDLTREVMNPLIEELLLLRTEFRQKKLWNEADMIRDTLHRAGILVEDTKNGPQWRFDA